MLWTLQRYIFREMGKAFALTAIGLIAVLGLGGGVLNMIELEGVTLLQLLKIMGLILPVAATLTLPIAALYSATVTYGRLSADNEFVACRSGGVNIHVLFLPTIVISLVSALCSFFFINFVIPGMIMNIDRFVSADLPRHIRQRLSMPSRLALRDRHRIYADRVELGSSSQNATGDNRSLLKLGGVAFVEMENDAWTRFGTAESVTIGFGSEDGTATISAEMNDVSLYDAKAGRYSDNAHESIESFPIPQKIPLKVKWLSLGDLLRYRRQPTLFPPVQEQMATLRAGIARAFFYRDIQRQFVESAQRLREYGQIHLVGEDTRYTIQTSKLTPSRRDAQPLFEGGVTIHEQSEDGERRVTADSAVVYVSRTAGRRAAQVHLRATGNVTIEDSRNPSGAVRRDRADFDPVGLPESAIRNAQSYRAEKLLSDTDRSLGLGEWVDQKRKKVSAEIAEISRDITGVLHSRMALSLSVFVLVILGAALGIVFRGSHVLTAFGISFIPSLFVITMIIMGKQLIDKPSSGGVGIAVVWLGIVLVAAVDVLVMMKGVRR